MVVNGFTLRLLYHQGKSSRYSLDRWMGCWVEPRADLDAVVNKRIPVLAWNLTPVVQPLASQYTN